MCRKCYVFSSPALYFDATVCIAKLPLATKIMFVLVELVDLSKYYDPSSPAERGAQLTLMPPCSLKTTLMRAKEEICRNSARVGRTVWALVPTRTRSEISRLFVQSSSWTDTTSTWRPLVSVVRTLYRLSCRCFSLPAHSISDVFLTHYNKQILEIYKK